MRPANKKWYYFWLSVAIISFVLWVLQKLG